MEPPKFLGGELWFSNGCSPPHGHIGSGGSDTWSQKKDSDSFVIIPIALISVINTQIPLLPYVSGTGHAPCLNNGRRASQKQEVRRIKSLDVIGEQLGFICQGGLLLGRAFPLMGRLERPTGVSLPPYFI